VIPVRGREGIFLFTPVSRPVLDPTWPPVQVLPGVKWPGHEASVKVKNAWRYLYLHSSLSSWCGA